MSSKPIIHLQDVSFQAKGRSIIESFNLSIESGTATGIIGPSGSGKSLLLKLIAGILMPSSGTITVNSEHISMLFQKNALFDSCTLRENLLLPLEEALRVDHQTANLKAEHLLKAVGLEQSIDLYPDEISGGMQKRLGIARALCVDPEVILYDEPTAGLDPITSKSIADLMIKLHRENKTTLLMVTNDLQRAYQVCDQIIFCSNKTLRILGTPTQVKKTEDSEVKKFIYANAISVKDQFNQTESQKS